MLFRSVEDQMNSLKRQAAKADRYVKLSDELREKRRRFWGRSYALRLGRKSALDRELALLAEAVIGQEFD